MDAMLTHPREDEDAQLHVPPGHMILEDEETTFVGVRGALVLVLGVVMAVLVVWGLVGRLAAPSLLLVVGGISSDCC